MLAFAIALLFDDAVQVWLGACPEPFPDRLALDRLRAWLEGIRKIGMPLGLGGWKSRVRRIYEQAPDQVDDQRSLVWGFWEIRQDLG